MPGAKQITLEVCNGPSCDSGTALVTVLVPPDPSFNCEPLTAGVDDLVSCIALDGNATSYSWSTLSGMPASGMEQSFSTRYALAGSKTISLEVCNAVECRSFSQGITVADPISATISCSPSPAHVGQTVVCSPTILEGGPAVSYNWQASDQFEPILGDANPASGDQQGFVTAFSFAGTKLITLAVCNATSCASAFTTVLVGSASPPVFEAFSCNPTTAKLNQPIQCDALRLQHLAGSDVLVLRPQRLATGRIRHADRGAGHRPVRDPVRDVRYVHRDVHGLQRAGVRLPHGVDPDPRIAGRPPASPRTRTAEARDPTASGPCGSRDRCPPRATSRRGPG